MNDQACPGCGIPARGWTDEGGGRVSIWPCGCWVTRGQAQHIIHARGDDT